MGTSHSYDLHKEVLKEQYESLETKDLKEACRLSKIKEQNSKVSISKLLEYDDKKAFTDDTKDVPNNMKKKMKAVFGYQCHICSKIITPNNNEPAAGHIIAKSKGGATALYNLRPVCTKCNSKQGTQDMAIYIKRKYPNNVIKNMRKLVQAVDDTDYSLLWLVGAGFVWLLMESSKK